MKEYIIELSDNENALSILVKAYNLHELVRCKDCKYGVPSSDGLMLCNNGVYFDRYKKSDWFCADGEEANRRTDTLSEVKT